MHRYILRHQKLLCEGPCLSGRARQLTEVKRAAPSLEEGNVLAITVVEKNVWYARERAKNVRVQAIRNDDVAK